MLVSESGAVAFKSEEPNNVVNDSANYVNGLFGRGIFKLNPYVASFFPSPYREWPTSHLPADLQATGVNKEHNYAISHKHDKPHLYIV